MLENNKKVSVDFTNPQLRYHHIKDSEVSVKCFVYRVFNKHGKLVEEPRSIEVFKLYQFHNDELARDEWKLDLTQFAISKGFPSEEVLEFIAFNLIVTREKESLEIPLFPGESETYVDLSLPGKARQYLDFDNSALNEISNDYGFTILLLRKELSEIAGDMLEGLSRIHREDPDGAIKFFRKVIEGWKRFLESVPKNQKNRDRVEKLKRFSATTYDLVSNFGEHSSTIGGNREAKFAKSIATSLSEYLLKYLKSELANNNESEI